MKKFFLEDLEKERIKLLYESYGIILNEDSIWGILSKKALSFIGKNEDDIARLFKTTEVALAKNLDDIVRISIKSKSITQLDDIQIKLMHIFNPSGAAENIAIAQQKTKNFLNGYAKSRGESGWKSIRDEVSGAAPTSQRASSSSSSSSTYSKSTYDVLKDIFKSGNNISSDILKKNSQHIDWSKVTNAKNIDDYNLMIVQALQNQENLKYISSGGFEKFGITNFRDFLRKSQDFSSRRYAMTQPVFWNFKIK